LKKKNTKLEIYFLFHCLFNKMAVFKEQFKHTKYTFNKTSDEINKSEMILFLLVYKTMVYNDNNI